MMTREGREPCGACTLLCAPLLILCWLSFCSDECSDSSDLEAEAPNSIVSVGTAFRWRSNGLLGRRFGSSAVSLHLPSTSGHSAPGTKQPLSGHRSQEEIRSRRKSHNETGNSETFHRSAPTVIDEILHRRDWESSSKELHIPLKPANDKPRESISSASSDGQSFDGISVVEKTDEQIVGTSCKKHYTNIRSSGKSQATNKEFLNEDIKDEDATENLNFYIGDTSCQLSNVGEASGIDNELVFDDVKLVVDDIKSPKAKETKQSLNESIRSKDRPKKTLVPLTEFQVSNAFDFEDVDDIMVDRSGAVHHSVESRSSLFDTHTIPFPPPSVEAVGYDSDASYLEEASGPPPSVSSWRRVSAAPLALGFWARPRHASVGDVLAPSLTLRPQSGALSESDLDFELEGCDEPPPAYDEVQLLATIDRKETAI